MTRTNADIDNLLNSRLHLIEQAARSLCSHRADELTWEIIPLWYRRYLANPQKYWDMLNNPRENEVVADMKQFGKRVLEWWQRAERDESLEALSDFQTLNPIEWGECNVKQRYLDGIGDYANGDYLPTNEELQRLFESVARHNMTDEHGKGLGRVDAFDLMTAFLNATPNEQRDIKWISTGRNVSDLPNRSKSFMAVAGVLRTAL